MVIVAGRVAIQPERRADAVEAMHKVVAATKPEPGCIAYDFYVDIADPNMFHVYEEWESDAALSAHLQQAHTQEFLGGIGDLVASPPVVNKYEVASGGSLL
jgi:quinol monooxygenase YgiN